MFEIIEDQNNELKERFEEETILKEIVGFLNGDGGNIYIGINDDKKLIGVDEENIDEIQKKISNMITDNIQPAPISLVKMQIITIKDLKVLSIKIDINDLLYSIKKYGFSSKGCPIRIGATTKQMDFEEIKKRYNKSYLIENDNIINLKTLYKGLTFSTLKTILIDHGFDIDDESFLNNYNLINENGDFNLMAELLSDHNNNNITFIKFSGKDESSISQRLNYGNSSLISSYFKIKDRIISENICKSDTSVRPRKDIFLYDFEAVNEAILNAFLHNDYLIREPLIKMFSDRLEIISYGGLPKNQSIDKFFMGRSIPRNNKLMNIFLKLDLVEETGHGVKKIINRYDKDVFNILDTMVIVTIPFNKYLVSTVNDIVNKKEYSYDSLIDYIKEIKKFKQIDILNEFNISKSTSQRIINKLISLNIIKKIGSNKNGYYEINGTVNGTVNDTINETINETINNASNKKEYSYDNLITYIKEIKKFNQIDIINAFNISKRTSQRIINRLISSNAIKKIGSDKNGHYEINGTLNGTVNGTVNGTLNGTVNKIEYSYENLIKYINEIKKFKQIDIMNKFSISKRTAQRIINKLISSNTIKKIGSDKNGYYEIIENIK